MAIDLGQGGQIESVQSAAMELEFARRTRTLAFAGLVALAMLLGPLFAQASAADGPFGIAMGADPKSFPSCAPQADSPGVFECTNVPRPHPAIRLYFLIAWPSTGVCSVGGASDPIQTSDFGGQLQHSVDEMAAQIEEAYGPSSKIDDLTPGSLWTDPQEWMMGLYKGDREYKYLWNSQSGARFKNNVASIFVGAIATGTSAGEVLVKFFFSNHAACDDAAKKSGASAF